jgi:hypothetical protein
MKKTYPFEDAQSSADENEATGYGRFSPEHEPTGEDKLYFIILKLVRQDCSYKDLLDSCAISAYERAIEAP